LTVRSGHHQAVDVVGPGLRVAARAHDGIIEAVEHPTRWVLGVQFHPEDVELDETTGPDPDHQLALLLDALLSAASDRARSSLVAVGRSDEPGR
jgi:putative glutamine amidotransferase